jgi:hypothetical protein
MFQDKYGIAIALVIIVMLVIVMKSAYDSRHRGVQIPKAPSLPDIRDDGAKTLHSYASRFSIHSETIEVPAGGTRTLCAEEDYASGEVETLRVDCPKFAELDVKRITVNARSILLTQRPAFTLHETDPVFLHLPAPFIVRCHIELSIFNWGESSVWVYFEATGRTNFLLEPTGRPKNSNLASGS